MTEHVTAVATLGLVGVVLYVGLELIKGIERLRYAMETLMMAQGIGRQMSAPPPPTPWDDKIETSVTMAEADELFRRRPAGGDWDGRE